MSWWLRLIVGQVTSGGGEGLDKGSSPPPLSPDEESVARLDTSEGEAAVMIDLVHPVILEGEVIEFRLVNCGNVALMSSQYFSVERWSGASWNTLPAPRIRGVPVMFSDEGWLLQPGASAPTQQWPFKGEEVRLEPGWYRLVKSATYEGKPHAPRHDKLVARTQVRVEARRG